MSFKGEVDASRSPNVTWESGGQTATHMPAYNDDLEGVRLLLSYEAVQHIKDVGGETGLDCVDVKAKGFIPLLEDHESRNQSQTRTILFTL